MNKNTKDNKNIICPHLGLKDDQSTFLSYPSSWNVCHHVKPPFPPNLPHQQSTCLSASYPDCPIFKAPAGEKMPEDIRDPETSRLARKRLLTKIMLLIGTVAVVVLGILFYKPVYAGLSQLLSPLWQQKEPVSSYELPPTKTPTLIPTAEIIPTLTPTVEPGTPTFTPTDQPPVLALDTPIGGDVQYIIHQATLGESIGLYATRYNTTEEAIRASNFNLPPVLRVDQIIVIPMDRSDVTDLPAFEAVMVDEGPVSVEDLADELSVAVEGLLLYNDLQEGHELTSGDWILVPRE